MKEETTIKERYALVAKNGVMVNGWSSLETVLFFQKLWYKGHPSPHSKGTHGWVTPNGCTYGGLVSDLLDTHIVKRTEIVITQVVPNSPRKGK